MKTKTFLLAVSLSVLAARPIWARQENKEIDIILKGQVEIE